MKNLKAIVPALVVIGLAGCPVDDDVSETNTDTDTASTTMTTTTSATSTTDTSTTSETDTSTTSATSTTTDGGTDTEDTTGSTGPDPEIFQFRDDAFTDYTRVDRMGMPAVNTAFITSKDDFNAGDPADDLDDFRGEVVDAFDFLMLGPTAAGNGEGLRDDLEGIPLVTCTVDQDSAGDPLNVGTCLETNLFANGEEGGVIMPDDVGVDTTVAAGFPNGRGLENQVMDLILALTLLDLGDDPFADEGGGDQLVTTFSAVPLNPGANDVAFSGTFPYLAAAN
jgi:hypothetical protein